MTDDEVTSTTRRYDAVADSYADFTRDWSPEPLAQLPDDVRGARILDLACGQGHVSRYLARRGAIVTGLDLSPNMLGHALTAERNEPLGVRYVEGDATNTRWWDGAAFDGVICHMAFMDIGDLEGALATVATVLVAEGWFSFSICHPCYPGGPEGSSSGLSSWPPDRGYSAEGWWSTGGEGVRGRVGANHRMLSTYLNAVLRAGFDFDEFAEPEATVPLYLVALCRRGPT